MTIYLGNIPYESTEAQIYELLTEFGDTFDLNYPRESVTGKHRGFAFVTIFDNARAQEAIRTLNGSVFEGRKLLVSEAIAQNVPPSQGIPVGFRKMGENPFFGGGRRR